MEIIVLNVTGNKNIEIFSFRRLNPFVSNATHTTDNRKKLRKRKQARGCPTVLQGDGRVSYCPMSHCPTVPPSYCPAGGRECVPQSNRPTSYRPTVLPSCRGTGGCPTVIPSCHPTIPPSYLTTFGGYVGDRTISEVLHFSCRSAKGACGRCL